MNVGMLWFDNDPKINLDAKIERAASFYHEKYGRIPTLCFVNPSMLRNGKSDVEKFEAAQPNSSTEKSYAACGVEIRPNNSVLPNHFWIGVNGSN
jgi:hypothetical protein